MFVLRKTPQPKWQSMYDLLSFNFEGDVAMFLIELDSMEALLAFIADCDFHRIK